MSSPFLPSLCPISSCPAAPCRAVRCSTFRAGSSFNFSARRDATRERSLRYSPRGSLIELLLYCSSLRSSQFESSRVACPVVSSVSMLVSELGSRTRSRCRCPRRSCGSGSRRIGSTGEQSEGRDGRGREGTGRGARGDPLYLYFRAPLRVRAAVALVRLRFESNRVAPFTLLCIIESRNAPGSGRPNFTLDKSAAAHIF